MFQRSEKYFKLIDYYQDMVTNGYHRDDGIFINKTYGTAEPIKFKEHIKKIISYLNGLCIKDSHELNFKKLIRNYFK